MPNHLKRKNNASRPIEVEDSEEERDDHCGNIEIDEPGSLKKRPRSSLPLNIEADNLDIPSPSLVLFQLHSPVAGPSGPKEPPPPLTPAELLLHVLEVLPDVCPDFALKLLKAALLEGRVQKLVEKVVDHALEMVGGYPKMGEAKGKEKAIVQAAGLSYLDKDHRKEERMGKGYRIKSLGTLEETFPRIPVPQSVFRPVRIVIQIDCVIAYGTPSPPSARFMLLPTSRSWHNPKRTLNPTRN